MSSSSGTFTFFYHVFYFLNFISDSTVLHLSLGLGESKQVKLHLRRTISKNNMATRSTSPSFHSVGSNPKRNLSISQTTADVATPTRDSNIASHPPSILATNLGPNKAAEATQEPVPDAQEEQKVKKDLGMSEEVYTPAMRQSMKPLKTHNAWVQLILIYTKKICYNISLTTQLKRWFSVYFNRSTQCLKRYLYRSLSNGRASCHHGNICWRSRRHHRHENWKAGCVPRLHANWYLETDPFIDSNGTNHLSGEAKCGNHSRRRGRYPWAYH